MRRMLLIGALAVACTAGSGAAEAKGCLKGAAVGAVGGHFVHHPVVGAAVGCAVGHHYANKHAKQQQQHSKTAPAHGQPMH